MKNFSALLAAFLLIPLSGCMPGVRVEVLTRTTYIPLSVNEAYLEDCDLASPPTPDEVRKMNADERDYRHSVTLLSQYEYTRACSRQKQAIRKQLEDNRRLVEEMNNREEQRLADAKKKLGK